jgi:mercuric ion transport protein
MIPLLLAAGVLGGAGWAAAGRIMPGIALALVAGAGLAWWWLSWRRHADGCAGGGGCSCDDRAGENGAVEESPEGISVRSLS